MKPFDLEKAKAGTKLCTRDGRPARIVCYDMMGDFPIVALIATTNNDECVVCYTKKGTSFVGPTESANDLFLAPTKREGWVNIYDTNGAKSVGAIYETKEKAQESILSKVSLVDTVHIEWEG